LILDFSQFFTQARSIVAILCRLDTELDGTDASNRIDNLGDATALALAGMLELVGEIVLVQGVGLQFVNAAVKILDVRPALGLRDGSIGDRGVGEFQYPPSRVPPSERSETRSTILAQTGF
jgi:hypothetical protein